MAARLGVVVCAIVVIFAISRSAYGHPSAGIVVAADGTVYFVHGPSCRVYSITPAGDVSVLVEGSISTEFRVPHHLIMRGDALFTVSDAGNHVWRVDRNGSKEDIFPHADYTGPTIGAGGDPVTIDADGNIIAAIIDDASIIRIRRDGTTERIAGGGHGHADGRGSEAKFGTLGYSCFAWGPDGALFVTDDGTRIRRIAADGTVSTVVDHSADQPSPPAALRFGRIVGLAVGHDGMMYVADESGRRIWKVTPQGSASVFAGSGERGLVDGPAETAAFEEPVGIAIGPRGNLYVTDYGWADGRLALRVRRILPDGAVTTIAETRPEVY